ncbi:hypothetical protein ACFXJ9_02535, partial [Embleya sp. NPDC059259]
CRVPRAACRVPRAACRVPRAACRVPRAACRVPGIGITACGVLSRGLIGAHWSRERAVAPGDVRAISPRSPESGRRLLLAGLTNPGTRGLIARGVPMRRPPGGALAGGVDRMGIGR